MGEVSFSRTIRVKAICKYCKNDCGHYYFSVGEYNLICFNCVDEMKKQADKKRHELEEAEIQEFALDIQKSLYVKDAIIAKNNAITLYSVGYRKIKL
ncbi:hypothetical protein [Arsenophonus nasoniae]|uniref:Uncharacterized protein n=1 Tax=Arsenophonus nasoniae TaxID=638 RepID=A0AA95GIL0_9GAMM|nr:hypothetical protein [Arsenophonus nasoniae]WGL96514.1 hypothetical protein QE207_08230 [Arsenophonus nasoniae]